MRYFLSFYIFFIVSNSFFGQQNNFLNLGSSVRFSDSKSKTFDLLTSQKSILQKKAPLTKFFEEQPFEAFGESNRFNSNKNWKNNKKEIRIGIGATQFLGDLGGTNLIGADYRLKDMNIKATNMCLMVGYRHRLSSKFATTSNITLGMLAGSDANIIGSESDSSLIFSTDANGLPTSQLRYADGYYRRMRNLSFRAPILEISQRLDFMIYTYEKVGKRYSIAGLKGFKNRNEQIYIFAGIGLVGFIPQAQIDGSWHNLRPLSTEGQGLLGGIKKYSPVTVVMPFGFGFRVGISREWRIGMEASYVKTFSDYIDDVHGVYYNKELLAAQKGEMAAALSDRSDYDNPNQHNWYGAGQKRGDKQKDAYFYVNIILTRNITYRNYTKTYRHFKLSKGKYKF